MYSLRIVLALLAVFIGLSQAVAAEVKPAPPTSSDQPRTPPSAEAAPQPEMKPSPTDPGMVKQPEMVPHPDSVVTPPVVDPKMAVNPEEPTHDQMVVPREGAPGPPPASTR